MRWTDVEAVRQIGLLVSNTSNQHPIVQQTLTFDDDTLLTRPLRTKEKVEDYRYMPDPNLPSLVINREYVDAVRRNMSVLGMENDGAVGWEAVKLRLKKRLGLDESSKSDQNDVIERDLSVLMQLDAGKNVGWDGEVVPGAVTFFEDVLNASLDARKVTLDQSVGMEDAENIRDPRVVLNWYAYLEPQGLRYLLSHYI